MQPTPADRKSSCSANLRLRFCVGSILLAHALLLAYSASTHSPTLNEPAHLVAGISHWQTGSFHLYRVNPPLVRMVAALPVLAFDVDLDETSSDDPPWRRTEFHLGADFMAANGPRAFSLITLARWSTIPLGLLGGVICFRWAQLCWGSRAGLVALLLWCFSPTVLAHGSLMTPDAHASALAVAAGFTYWQWLRDPRWSASVVAGLVLGLAQLAKTTLLLFFILWPAMWLVYRGSDARRAGARDTVVQLVMLLTQLGTAILVINAGYGFEQSFCRLGEFSFVSQALKDCDEQQRIANRFADSTIGQLRVPLPGNFVRGIDVQRADFERFSRPSYLNGRFQDRGWWYYYAYALAVKLPLGIWLLAMQSAGLNLRRVFTMGASPRRELTGWRDQVAILTPAVGIFVAVSSQTGFSHHMRYILPALPFALIWTSQVAEDLGARGWAAAGCIVAPLSWMIMSSLSVYPHSLSYFNELAGGPQRGDAHLINSNIDWGQDLLYLADWLDGSGTSDDVQLAYYGGFDPGVAGIQFTLPNKRNSTPGVNETADSRPAWVAVSVNFLRGFPYRVFDPSGASRYARAGDFSHFRELTPVASAGYSIRIFRPPLRRGLGREVNVCE